MKQVLITDTGIIIYNGVNQVVQHPTTVFTEDSATVTPCTPIPMPAMGQQCTINAYYMFDGYMYKCRQTHNRTTQPPILLPALFAFYRINAADLNWVAGEAVEVGWERIYNGIKYQVIQAHQTQSDWTPPQVPALWKDINQRPIAIGEWGYPVVYKVNDLVTYQSKTYKCLQAHTSQVGWNPVAVPALWQVQV